ncbi:MAG: hypothetical protein ABSD56_00740 [Bryobacteraceae bacterium]
MKSAAVFLLLAFGALGAQPGAPLSAVRRVYFFPMTNGLDQYLANRITNAGTFEVVTDPKKADAVFTDRLGVAFEDRMNDLFRPSAPAAPTVAPVAATTPAAPTAPAATVAPAPPASPAAPAALASGGATQAEPQPAHAAPETPAKQTVPFSTFGRAKGTVFLVDARTRAVVWSVYERPRGSTSIEFNRTAGRIAARLKRDLSRK